MTSNLGTILGKVKECNRTISTPIEEGTYTSRVARDAQQAAKYRLDELKKDYRNALLDKSAFIVIYGEGSDKAAKIAEKDFGSFAANTDQVITRVANEIPTNFMGQQAGSALFDFISHVLEGVAAEAGVVEFPYPQYKADRHARIIKTKADLEGIIRDAITNQVGGELLAVHAVTATYLRALETEFDGKVYPLVLYVQDKTFAAELARDITGRLKLPAFTISTTPDNAIDDQTLTLEKVDKASIKSAFTKIRTALGGKK